MVTLPLNLLGYLGIQKLKSQSLIGGSISWISNNVLLLQISLPQFEMMSSFKEIIASWSSCESQRS